MVFLISYTELNPTPIKPTARKVISTILRNKGDSLSTILLVLELLSKEIIVDIIIAKKHISDRTVPIHPNTYFNLGFFL